jgi:histidine triad (HIT) family protein
VLRFAKPVAEAIESVVPCKRVGLMVAGLEVPHAHLHLVPINQIGDLNFDNAAPTDGDVLAALAADIRAAISA